MEPVQLLRGPLSPYITEVKLDLVPRPVLLRYGPGTVRLLLYLLLNYPRGRRDLLYSLL